MSGDPKVLGPLQREYLQLFPKRNAIASERVLDIQQEWDEIVHDKVQCFIATDAEIRAWTPPPAEPSLEQRVGALSVRLSGYIAAVDFALSARIAALEQHPEPTAPDDYTPGQYKRARGCAPPINPSPRPALDLDPVRVEAAAKAANEQADWMWAWDDRSELARANLTGFAAAAIRAYLNDGGA